MKEFIHQHKKLLIALAVALVVVGGAGIAFSALNSDNGEDSDIEAYTVQVGNISSTVSGKGYVTAGKEVNVTSPTGIVIQDVLVKNGDAVTAGETLATVDDSSITGKLADAIDAETAVQRRLDTENLTQIQRDALLDQRSSIRSYISQLEDLRYNPVLTAPQNGVITQVNVAAGVSTSKSISDQQALSQSQSQGSSSSNSNVSLIFPIAETAVFNPESFSDLPKICLEYIKCFFNYLIDPAQPVESTDTIKEELQCSDGGSTPTDNSDYYEEIIEESESKYYYNGREGFVPDTESSNTEEVIYQEVTEESPSTSESQTSSTPATLSQGYSVDFSENEMIAFKIGTMDDITVTIDIDERDILSVAVGQTATVSLDALPDQNLTGTISKIAGQGQTTEGNSKYSVEVTLPANVNLKSGMTANVTIDTASKQNVLIIPVEALQERSGRKFVYTKNEDGTLSGEVDVTTGIADKNYVEITGGINDGTVIYYQKTGTPDLAEAIFSSDEDTEESEE